VDLNEDIKGKINIDTNGYPYAYLPNNPCANKAGKVYIHRLIMSKKLNRLLLEDEVVHHKDENKLNFSLDNLELTNQSEHGRMHQNKNGFVKEDKNCLYCDGLFTPSQKKVKFCSPECYALHRRKFNVDEEELKILVWSMPTVKVAKLFNVSDKAIERRCKKYGIEKPPRGYWRKVECGIIK